MNEPVSLVRREWEAILEVRAQQAEVLDSLKKITSDHEIRLRFLERTVGYGLGALALIKFFLDYTMK